MSKTYLDKTGATYLVSKIWDYVKTKMASWDKIIIGNNNTTLANTSYGGIIIGKKNYDLGSGIAIGNGNSNKSGTLSTYLIGVDNAATSGGAWAFGKGLISRSSGQMAFGEYNAESSSAFVFGHGYSDARQNLFEMDLRYARFHKNTTDGYALYIGDISYADKVPTYSDLSSLIQIDESTGDLYITY